MMSRFNGPVTGTVVPNTPPPGPPPQVQQQQIPQTSNFNAPINNMTPMAMRTTPQLMPAQPNSMQRLMPGQTNPIMTRSVERPTTMSSNNTNSMNAMYNRPSALMPRAMSTGNAMMPNNVGSNASNNNNNNINTPMATNNFMQPPLQAQAPQPQGNVSSHPPPPPPPRLMPHPVSTYSALRATSTPSEAGRLATGNFTIPPPIPPPPPPPPGPNASHLPPSQPQQQTQAAQLPPSSISNSYNPNMTAMSASTVNGRPSSAPREPQAAYQYAQPPQPQPLQYKVSTPAAQPPSQSINTISEVDLATLATPLQQQIIARLQ